MNLLPKKSCTSTEFDLKLLELVKNRPLLWDTRQMDYKSSEKKMMEWQLIAEELGSEATVVRRRFDNIRGGLRRALHKLNKWNIKPVGMKPQPYKYIAELDFIMDFLNQEKFNDSSALTDSDYEEEHNHSDTQSVLSSDEKTEPPSKKMKVKNNYDQVFDAMSSAVTSFNKFAAEVSGRLNETTSASKCAPLDDDDDWLFARRVYNKLRVIPEGRDKELFKCRIDAELVNLIYGDDAPDCKLYAT